MKLFLIQDSWHCDTDFYVLYALSKEDAKLKYIQEVYNGKPKSSPHLYIQEIDATHPYLVCSYET